jgi:hypothetical protein
MNTKTREIAREIMRPTRGHISEDLFISLENNEKTSIVGVIAELLRKSIREDRLMDNKAYVKYGVDLKTLYYLHMEFYHRVTAQELLKTWNTLLGHAYV